MNSRLHPFILGAAAIMAATPAGARQVDAFPERLMPSENHLRAPINRAPLNQEASLGTKVFGTTLMDYNLARSFSNYYENRYELEKLNLIYDEAIDDSSVPTLYIINAGAYNTSDGNYYAYKVKYYTIGITYAYQWLKVNPADGKWEVLATLENHSHDHTPLYDMAYSPYDDEMYGLVQNDDGQVKSRIGKVNLSNSEVYDLIQLDEYYLAAAFDYDGNLYAIRWDYNSEGNITGTRLDRFDMDFKVVDSKKVTVDGKAFMSYYQHGLDFDYTTGELIWAATNNEADQYMVRIEPETAATTNYGKVGFNEVMTGLHVPYTTAAHREAPAKVNGLGFTIDPQGQNNVTISWTNPTTKWNRTALDNLVSVKIYRDAHSGAPIATVDAAGKEGEKMEFTDKGAHQGIHKYYVIAVNDKGEGVETFIEAFVGRDVPGQVNDLTVKDKDNGKSVEITWTAPTVGASEGWFDSKITYDVERLPGNTKLATGLETLSYTDANIEESQFYSYVITPVTSDGRGESRTSDGILAGGSLKVPFSTEFSTRQEAARFLSFYGFGGNSSFEYTHNNTKPGTMAMIYQYQPENDATLSSPPMNLTKGKKYRVDWHVTLCGFGRVFEDRYNHFKIMGGTAPNAQEMTEVLADHKDFLSIKAPYSCVITTYFESPVDGDYCVGLNVATNDQERKDDWIYVTGFSISESPADDLAAEKLTCPLIVSANNDNYFDVEVYNNGDNKQRNYKVEIGIARLDGVFEPFASTDKVLAIEPHDTQTIRVVGKPGKYGIQDIAARVVLTGDGNADNDISGMCQVKVEAGSAYNNTANDTETNHTDSGLPFSVYHSNSASQTIYTPEMLGFENEHNLIDGLAWEYTSSKEISNIKMKVYLGATDKSEYDKNRGKFITEGNNLVYDGTVAAEMDEENFRWMNIRFPDSPFSLPKDKGLVVTVIAEETANNGAFPLLFKVFNSSNANPDIADNLYHTVIARDSKEIDIANPGSIFKACEMPVLHISLGKGSGGVGEISGDGGDLGFSILGNAIRFNGNAAYAAVYDMNGRLLIASAVESSGCMPLNLCNGIYILRVQDADGNMKSAKFIVR